MLIGQNREHFLRFVISLSPDLISMHESRKNRESINADERMFKSELSYEAFEFYHFKSCLLLLVAEDTSLGG